MEKKIIALIAIAALYNVLFTASGKADVPAPPANQLLGLDDGIFNNLEEADCRACHDDPDVVGGPANSDRHHLLFGQPVQEGACSVNGNTCITDGECDPDICEFGYPLANDPFACSEDIDCPDFNKGVTCGEICVGETAALFTDTDGDGTPDALYSCSSCHPESSVGGVIGFEVIRDCVQCHVQASGEASVHHLTATAQGADSPIGDPNVGDCTPCHGTLVDDIGDGHDIPTYAPSLFTPSPSGGTAEPLNSEGNGRGACNYCHSTGTGNPFVPGTDTLTGTLVYGNNTTHHSAGVHKSRTGGSNRNACEWCHPPGMHGNAMRTCEGCHGYESLHNIQVDSDGDGDIVAGGELPGYGHIGNDDPTDTSDCAGCHLAFTVSSAIGAGPISPYIANTSVSLMVAGTDTQITLTGSAFTNMMDDIQFLSEVTLADADGTGLTLTPDSISESSLTVTIPGTTAPGNYTLRAVKDLLTASNPVSLSIKPPVVITGIDCSKCLGTMTITGFGFFAKPEGTDEDLQVIEGDAGRLLRVISWTDTEIKALDARCRGDVTVNALFGSATRNQ